MTGAKLLGIATGCVLLTATTLVFAVGQGSSLPGLPGTAPYTPTRLEWLAVELQAGNRVELNSLTEYSLDFVALETENTILIYVHYLPSVNRTIMNMSIDSAREVIAINAKSRGWSSWLKVKERIEMAKGK